MYNCIRFIPDNANGDDSRSIDFAITPKSNQPPSIKNFTHLPDSPQTVGTTITWATDAMDPNGDQIFYEYLLNGDPVASWSKDNTWTWHTREKEIGNNIIEVLVRDGKHAVPDGYDDRKTASFTITAPNQYIPAQPPVTSSSALIQNGSSHGVSNINYYSGILTRSTDHQAWPFKLTLIGPTSGGSISGQIEWPTLNSINQIEGSQTANNITFSQIAYIKKGDVMLNCKYYLTSDGSSFKGTWSCDDDQNYGDITMNPS